MTSALVLICAAAVALFIMSCAFGEGSSVFIEREGGIRVFVPPAPASAPSAPSAASRPQGSRQ
jgi:hypothetical protein